MYGLRAEVSSRDATPNSPNAITTPPCLHTGPEPRFSIMGLGEGPPEAARHRSSITFNKGPGFTSRRPAAP
jgi:hypothetical protein